MPIYEYECPKCGTFEANQRITDSPLRRCPTCKSKVTKLISSTSFQLKGSGWYATDYAAKKSGSAGEKATETKESTAAKESGSAQESAPAKESDPSSKEGSTAKAAAA